MADERIDIEINDKIDSNIPKKLRDIATNADKGEASVKKLKAALASINATPARRLKEATDQVTSSLNRELNAQNSLAAATNKSALADAKAAVEKQRLATETERTNAAQARAAQAAARAQAAQLSLAAAQARTASSSGDLKARADRLRSSLDPLYAAQMRFNAEINEANTLLRTGAISMNTYQQAVAAADARLKAAHTSQNAFNANLSRTTATGRGTASQTANIAAQMNDLGVQFSMAAASSKPLQGVFMALIQQGSQLAYIASTMENGWKGVFATMGRMIARFLPLIALVGGLALALNELTKSADAQGLDKYVKSLGLTADEVKKLKDVHVTMGDTIKATWQVVSKDILDAFGISTDDIKSVWQSTVDFIIDAMRYAAIGVYSTVRTLVITIGQIVANIGKMFYNAGIAAKNLFLMSIEALVNKTIDGINKIGGAINWLSEAAGFGNVVGQLDHIDLGVGSVKDGMLELSTIDPWGTFVEGAQQADNYLRGLGARIRGLGARIRGQARVNAAERLAAQARELKDARGDGPAGRTGPVDRTAENRAQALRLVNMELDNELNRMKLLKPEREVQQRMDQIEQQLAQKKITLSQQERAELERKVRAIQDYAHVQEQADRIYEAAIGPQRTYNATLQAASELLAQGAISQARYNQEVTLAGRALQEATNPLFALEEAMTANEAALGKYGVELERHNYYESIRQAMLAKGIVLSAQYVAGLNAEVDALMNRNNALLQQQSIQSTIGEIVNPMLQDQMMLENKAKYYAEIERLRQADLLSEEQAQRAKYALDAKFNEMRLRGASSFFGELASLQSSGVKELAAIGKAAAIVQATIDGYLAVQKALASAPPPWNFALAAAVAVKTGATVASIASTNVGSFATGGQFMVDGKAGVDRNNINMNVSRGERVTVETPAQQRANDNNGGGTNVEVPVDVHNYVDPRAMVGVMGSYEGRKQIINIIEIEASAIKQLLG